VKTRRVFYFAGVQDIIYAGVKMIKNKKALFTIVLSLLVIGTAIMLPGCAKKDPAVIAAEVAREWASGNIDNVSKNIAEQVASDSPIFKTIVAKTIEKDINSKLNWKYSEPRKIGEDRYEVVATAYTDIDLAIMGMYTASIDYDLTIDTKNKKVITADMDPGSFALTNK
jgi:hypothetical protein